jgi:hypothetical protein
MCAGRAHVRLDPTTFTRHVGGVPTQPFSVVVRSLGIDPVPIVVERALYASPGNVTWASGSNALAAPLP